MPRSKGRAGWAWRNARARILSARPLICRWCGGEIDPDTKYPHPLSACVDHWIAITDNGPELDLANLSAMHRTCNQAKENSRKRTSRTSTRPATNPSRQW